MRIAHLTDLHLVERCYASRPALALARLGVLTVCSTVDFEGRRARALDALRHAHRAGADHVVLTGDLTEDGVASQFEMLAEVLAECPFGPERITLVPGNHDGYDDSEEFARALAGPLRAYAATSTPGVVTSLEDRTVLCPLSTVRPRQNVLSATGVSRADDVAHVERVAQAVGSSRHTIVVLQHHAPLPFRNPVRERFEGLRDARPLLALMECREEIHVLHGHVHAASDAVVASGRPPQVYCADAVRDDACAVRLYEVGYGALRAVTAPEPPAWPPPTAPAPIFGAPREWAFAGALAGA